jgi:hypothetical protein
VVTVAGAGVLSIAVSDRGTRAITDWVVAIAVICCKAAVSVDLI